MLSTNRSGFAVMNKERTAYSIQSEYIQDILEYCRNGDVIVKVTPKKIGYEVRIWISKVYKDHLIRLWHRYHPGRNIFWLNWIVRPVFAHKYGEVVYRSEVNNGS